MNFKPAEVYPRKDGKADILLFSKSLFLDIPLEEAEEKVEILNREFDDWLDFMTGGKGANWNRREP